MPVVHVVPTSRGMTHDEIIGRIQGGWQLLGRQAVQKGAAIATPGNPDGIHLEDAEVWILAEPMVPQSMVASMILQAMAHEDPLEELALEMFGMDLLSLQAAMEAALVAAKGGHSDAQGQHSSEG